MQHKASTHHSLAKALEILMAFAPHNQEIGTVQLSGRLGYHKSTVSRLLHVLMDYGFVRQSQESKKFTLGPSVIDLSSSIQESLSDNLTHIAKPHVDRLRDAIGETVVLEVVSGRSAVIAYIAEGGGTHPNQGEGRGQAACPCCSRSKGHPGIFFKGTKGTLPERNPHTPYCQHHHEPKKTRKGDGRNQGKRLCH